MRCTCLLHSTKSTKCMYVRPMLSSTFNSLSPPKARIRAHVLVSFLNSVPQKSQFSTLIKSSKGASWTPHESGHFQPSGSLHHLCPPHPQFMTRFGAIQTRAPVCLGVTVLRPSASAGILFFVSLFLLDFISLSFLFSFSFFIFFSWYFLYSIRTYLFHFFIFKTLISLILFIFC